MNNPLTPNPFRMESKMDEVLERSIVNRLCLRVFGEIPNVSTGEKVRKLLLYFWEKVKSFVRELAEFLQYIAKICVSLAAIVKSCDTVATIYDKRWAI